MKDKITCTCTTVVVAVAALLMTGTAFGQACGDADAGDCCSANGTPACNDLECCETVCAADSFCCETSWDSICAGEAEEMCGDLCGGGGGPCPGDGDCCSANGTPGCNDQACCELICAQDSFCCETSWDSLCADAAIQQCEVCGGGGTPDNDDCADRIEVFDGETEYSNIGATTDGLPHAGCDKFGDNDVQSDVWFNYTATCNGLTTFSLCGSGYDTKIAVYDGCDTANCPPGDDALLACNDDTCGLQSEVTVDVTAGNCYKIRVGGFGGAQGNGILTITCEQGPCPWDLDGDGMVGISDLLELLSQWGGPGTADFDGSGAVGIADLLKLLGAWGDCPSGDCAIDCEGASDEGEPCGDDTNGGCNSAGACVGDSGDCCQANGTPGCEDPACESAICAADPFCCDTEWDGICADAACSSPDCQCEETGTPFGSIACGETVCGSAWAEGGTRDTDWYEFTLDKQSEVVATLNSQFDGVVFFVDATDCAAPAVVGTTGASQDCESLQQASACLDAGTWVLFVATGNPDGSGIFEGFPCGFNNDYSVTLECSTPCAEQACCFGDGTCQMLTEADCNAQGGTPQGAGTTCADVDCPAICGDGAGDCCQSGGNGTPGCNDVECCEMICAADPFCCETSWDGICADAAAAECAVCNQPASNCCEANGTPGCDDPECEAAVCEIDPFCCDTEWDSTCAGEAEELCADLCGGPAGPCGDPAAGDCCSANGTPGCDDQACCEAVCAIDAFCCDTSWDGICAGEAADLCDICGGEPVECLACECPAGALEENEACGGDNNGGCNAGGVFQDVVSGDVICGTAWADGGSRDTDWYRVTVGDSGTVSGTVQANGPQVVFIVDISDCAAPAVLGEIGHSTNCEPGTATASGLTPGDQVAVFTGFGNPDGSGIFEGFACGSCGDAGADWDYTLEVSAD